MSIQTLKETLKDYARDIKVNLGNLLSPETPPQGLTFKQTFGVALVSAYATGHEATFKALEADSKEILTDVEREAIKGASAIMAMNNIYYRFLHLSEDKSFAGMPAQLRMQIIAKHGIEKVDFELYSLAASAIHGCGMCINSHVHEVLKGGITKEGIQSAIRVASVIHAFAKAQVID